MSLLFAITVVSGIIAGLILWNAVADKIEKDTGLTAVAFFMASVCLTTYTLAIIVIVKEVIAQ